MKAKILRYPVLACLGLLMLWSCQKEVLQEEGELQSDPALQGLTLDPICDYYLLPLAEDDGNTTVDFCVLSNQPVPCPPNQPEWGSVAVYKTSQGYPSSTLTMEVNLAPGWLAQSYSAIVPANGPIQTNGNLPVVTNDWHYEPMVPARNSFVITSPLLASQYPSSCFDWALQIEAVRFNFFGAVQPGSFRLLRAYDVSGSGSPFVIDKCYATCPLPDLTVTGGTCQGCRAEVAVTFHGCESLDVVSCKSIRQVVIVYDDCSRSYNDNLSGNSLSFPTNGKNISHVFVRSGCRANAASPAQDHVDTNGNSYPNVLRQRFDAICVNSNCN